MIDILRSFDVQLNTLNMFEMNLPDLCAFRTIGLCARNKKLVGFTLTDADDLPLIKLGRIALHMTFKRKRHYTEIPLTIGTKILPSSIYGKLKIQWEMRDDTIKYASVILKYSVLQPKDISALTIT